jgi:sulfatase maturation enzyme AslB (radical SAM superfamily)
MTKILVLGNNTRDTDSQVQQMADAVDAVNHGLIVDDAFVPKLSGFYHTTIIDIPWGPLIKLAECFDSIIMLDQPKQSWTHWKSLLSTYKVMCHLEKLGKPTQFRNNQNIKKFEFWQQYQKQNKSFCIYPWINKHSKAGSFTACARSTVPLTPISKLTNWKTDPGFNYVRQKMLAGEKLSAHCETCYYYEDRNIESYRQFETLDWVAKLDIEHVDDLDSIDDPYYYELFIGNKCNIKCRGCTPNWSDQIDREFKKFDILPPINSRIAKSVPNNMMVYASMNEVDIDCLTSKHRVYIHGGEPTIMSEVTDFMKECINRKNTDFDFSMCTNGMVLTEEFVELTKHFSEMHFSISVDGYNKINDYWRWGSKWDKIIKNAHLLQDIGHKISINTVPGIYNVTNLHLLFEFLDREFPGVGVYIQINYVDFQSAYNHPMPDLVIDSMERCMKTDTYFSDAKSCKTSIDSFYDYYKKDPKFDLGSLKQFFEFNDQLDRARSSRLGDYIPELEACRKFIL